MMKWLRIVSVFLIMGSLLAVGALYIDYRAFLNRPMAIPETGIVLDVAPGSSITSIGKQLQERGILESSLYLQVYARLTDRASRIQVGEYRIRPGTTPRDFLKQLIEGRIIQYALTIVEGWTFRQMLQAVAAHKKISNTLQGLDDEQIMARLGHPREHPEGRFFPDTYFFPAGTTDFDFLKRAFQTMEQRLHDAWQQRDPNLPLGTPYKVLILASIIEKETALPSERREIAGVLIRRLTRGMRLQVDPTVIYGLGEAFDGNIRKEDLHRDTPYNTYTHEGLPPTPIALPGAESLLAAVKPAPGDTLYFVARGDGSHIFTRTLREHNRAVQRYQLNGR